MSAGGYFEDLDGSGLAWLGKNNWGIEAHGTAAGDYFVGSGGTGLAWVGGNYWGIEAHGNGGGYFVDSDGPAFAAAGHGDFGIEGHGPDAGGYFADSTGSGHAKVGHANWGIEAWGTDGAGYFADSDGSGQAYVGYGDVGIDASGSGSGGIFQNTLSDEAAWLATGGGYGVHGFGPEAGGRFENTHGTSWANVAGDVWGIEAHGNVAGGYFKDNDGGTGVAYVGHSDFGIEAHGTEAGGYFDDSDGSGQAYVGANNVGIEALGTEAGGTFRDLDGTALASVAANGNGIDASGDHMGGHFVKADGSSWANVAVTFYGIRAGGDHAGGDFQSQTGAGLLANGNFGIRAFGSEAGGYFNDSDGTGYANVGYGDRGIEAFGDGAGGHFEDLDERTYSNVAISTYSIEGNGTKAFVQNHPYDRDAVIVYAAPEGDEVATYTRGTARLVNGEATVPLGETFKWVTNPDIGLTAHLTPREDCNGVYLADLSTEEMVVRELQNGTSGCAFDYLVYGLRIGFEEMSIVQEKQQEAYIPSMAEHRQLYQRRPDLMAYNSLERFKAMRRAAGLKDELDLSRARALHDAVVEFDPAIHEMSRPPEFEERPGEDATGRSESHEGRAQGRNRARDIRADDDGRHAVVPSGLTSAIPVDDEGNVYANSFRPSSQDFASLLAVSEIVEPGDVLVIDRDNQGMMRRAYEGSDTGVIGVVAAKPGVVLGTNPPASGESENAVSVSQRAAVALAGVVSCKVDADYGAVWPGDLLVTSPTPGHAMRTDAPLPGTMLGKALEPLAEGTGAIRVLVMLR